MRNQSKEYGMTPTLDPHLKIPYDIGSYIASLIPNLDKSDGWGGKIWAAHHFQFETGPDPARHQLKQGLLLEVSNINKKPQALHTKYGYWKVLGASHGSFEKIFAILQKTLHLKKIEEYKNPHLSLWAIQEWNGQVLPKPVRSDRNAGEYIPYSTCAASYKQFKKDLKDLSEPSAKKPPTLPTSSPSLPLTSTSPGAP
ncbi:MAG TPA: hypothetical protein VGO47_15095, partial [Chlamydiales bacterium]|nr:hypothetical protein [Chlamydiales bacterium]